MIDIITRHEWGARPPSKPLQRIPLPTPVLYIHHSAVPSQGSVAVREFQRYHMNQKEMRDIAYTFLIGDEGEVYVGRGAGYAHGGNTGEDNRISHSICLLGNFENHAPTKAAEDALVRLMSAGKSNGWWLLTDVRGHRSEPGASTACPGRHLFVRIPALTAAARVFNPRDPNPTDPLPTGDDMQGDWILDSAGKPGLYLSGGRVQRIDAAQRDLLRSLDVPARNLSAAHYEVALTFPLIVD